MYQPHHLLDLLACPRTGGKLIFRALGDEAVLLSSEGVAYPIVAGIVVTRPSSSLATDQCREFLLRHRATLEGLGGAFSAPATESALFGDGGENEAWHLEEMDYWERRFADMLGGGRAATPGPNRTLPRAKFLRLLPAGIGSGTILELGCGSSETLLDVYGSGLVNYIGLDLSFNACLYARRAIPEGLFLQGAVEALPLRRSVLATLVAYGVFHHLPGHESAIAGLLGYLRPGGLLIGVDPLKKPPVPRPFRRRAAGMSPHNEWIDWQNLLSLISGRAEVLACRYEYSPLRALMVRLFYDGMGLRSRLFTRFMMALDTLWLATAGRLHPSLGPAAVHYALRAAEAGKGGG